jgi:16S rRNA (guanine527-N7)-methyltransferase
MSISPLGDAFIPLITEAARRLGDAGVAIDPKCMTRLVVYLDAVATWGRRVDLTAARSAEELVDLSLADAAVLARDEPRPARSTQVVDVGSGAGAPGLVLAILRPDLRINLVEPREKRVAFLRSVIGQLGLAVVVHRSRSQELPAKRFDLAISRATLPPAEWLLEGARLARSGVWVLLAQGEAPKAEGTHASLDRRYRLPFTGASRRALRFVVESPADR